MIIKIARADVYRSSNMVGRYGCSPLLIEEG
jgi:hypothetical protein